MRRLVQFLLLSSFLISTFVLSAPVLENSAQASSSTKAYIPITPTRLLDTRKAESSSFLHEEARDLRVSGIESVPNTAIAVALNVTVVNPSSDGFLTVWPAGLDKPATSNLNFLQNEVVPNLVTVGVGTNGSISLQGFLYSLSGSLDVLVDVVGWYVAGFNPINPTRIMDTRNGRGGITLKPGETRDLLVQGAENLPAGSIGSVALNVTAVNPTQDWGYLTIWPTGTTKPTASSLNFVAGETAANAVLTGVGSGGMISIYNDVGNTDVLVDVTGWFDQGFDALTPFRLVDTRTMPQYEKVGPGETLEFEVLGEGDVPLEGVGAVAMNITVTGPTEDGYLTVWPSGRGMPTASSLNFVSGQTIPNAVISGVGDGGRISVYNAFGSVDVIVDVTGWYALSDTEGPQLVSLSMSPSSVNTSLSSQVVTVRARITDDLAGNAGAGYSSSPSQVRFMSPSGGQFVDAMLSASELISGTTTDGVYEYQMTVPRLAESGVWTISSFLLVDQVGNLRWRTAAELSGAGFPTTFAQTGQGDTQAPQLVSLSMSPSSVNTSLSSQVVTVRARITDDLAGNAGAGYSSSPSQVRFMSPSGGQFVDAMLSASELISGTTTDGVYEYQMTVPRLAESGVWTISSFLLVDQVGNLRWRTAAELSGAGFPTTFVNN